MIEVYTIFNNSGRPDRFIATVDTVAEAIALANEIEEDSCDRVRYGTTYTNENGFLHWGSE